jgi:malate dehydrogenase (oxaloacetate-decarboxylating)(NADP+)
LANLDNDLQKYLLLSDLQARNETLYYAVLMSDPATFMPLVYTPTVGEACQKFDHIFHAARGLYLPITARGRVKELLGNWPQKDVRFIVVTDGERILGWAISASAAWAFPSASSRSTRPAPACRRNSMLPITLDVGTNNQTCWKIRSISACASNRVRGEEYYAFVDEFVEAVQTLYPKCCLQWEDFANFNAVPILERYRDKICTYNDDIQGTAAVALAGILGALRISGQKMTDAAFPVSGRRFGRHRHRRVDQPGHGHGRHEHRRSASPQRAVRRQRPDREIADRSGGFPKAVRLGQAPVPTFVEAVKQLKPTGIIGVSAVPKLFNQQVIEGDGRINERPIIFPYSNPTSRSECTAEEAYRWSGGRAIFASGSPFPPVQIDGRTFVPGPGKQRLRLPGHGHGGAGHRGHPRDRGDVHRRRQGDRRAGDGQESLDTGLIYPPQSKIFDASLHVATRVAEYIFDKNLARARRPDDIAAHIRSCVYQPVYTSSIA